MPQVITANRLADGIVIFLGENGAWVERLGEARLFSDMKLAEVALDAAKADERANLVLDLFLFEALVSPQGVRAAHIRDAIRAAGPTVHPDHGKQAAQA